MGQTRWRAGHLAAFASAAIVLAITFWLWLQLRHSEISVFEQEAVRQATAAAAGPALAEEWLEGEESLRLHLAGLAQVTGAQVTALTLQGDPIAHVSPNGSGSDASAQSDWRNFPEVRSAMAGRDGTNTRALEDSDETRWMVAKLVRDRGIPVGILHFAFPRHTLLAKLNHLNNWLAAAAILGTLLAVLLILALAAYFERSAARLTIVVERVAAGELGARVPPPHPVELAALARSFNRMAEKFQRQIKKRAREKGRLNTVMRVMTDGLIILNRSGVVKLINPAGAAMLNTTVEKAMHRSFVQAVRDHRIAEVWKRCQRSGVEEIAAVELGVTQFMRVVVTPFEGRAGRGYLVMLQDMTQMRRLQTMRQDFISNVSHELRTPLASLRALAETLRDSALDDPPAAAHFLDRMEIEVDALTQMVEELLELSRIESGQVPLRLNPVLPHAAVVPAVERLRAQAERGHLVLDVQIPRELPLVLVDAGRIHQVITNLVHNAVKFTPSGGTITINAMAGSKEVTVMVSDSGIGIATHDLPRIFERFFKTDRSRAVGGTGLGLAIAKHIVQAHGGRIWATSHEGKGSTFYFTMPREVPEEEPQGSEGQPALEG